MMRSFILVFMLHWFMFAQGELNVSDTILIDHYCTDIQLIPFEFITAAKQNLVIAYGHTSHGSQLISGMGNLDDFMKNQGSPDGFFDFNSDGSNDALTLHDSPFQNAYDLGNPDFTSWASETRVYLNNHPEVNVIMWSWCGQVSWASENDIDTYLQLMDNLETDYPGVQFVYITGHLDGSGIEGTLHQNNNRIRNFCRVNGKILYDFADIESFDPDGETNYMALLANDNCDYDSDSDGNQDSNWATNWQNNHTVNVDWYNCDAAHSQPLNGNLKAYAAWWLFAQLAGWKVQTNSVDVIPLNGLNYPLKSWISEGICHVELPLADDIFRIDIYNSTGQKQSTVKRIDSPESSVISFDMNDCSLQQNQNLLFLHLKGTKNHYCSKLIVIQ